MKNSYIKFIALGLVGVVTITYSCKKLLTTPPVGVLSGATLANKAGVDGLLIGAYSMLDGYTNTYGTSWESSIDNWVYGGIASDDAYKGSNTTDQPTAAPIENHSVDAANEFILEKWKVCYNSIQRANDVIREIPLVTDGSISADYAKQLIAEARFLRGIYHFEAAKMYRNVPYVDETITYGAGNFNVANPGPIWDKIEADFQAAYNVLPATQSQVGRANKYAAEALLAKAYMFDHKYTQALPLLTDLISNGVTSSGAKYALGPYEDNFNAIKRNSPEGVFQVQMTVNDGSGGNNGALGDDLNFPAGTYTGCCGFYQPSVSLANAFQTTAAGLPLINADGSYTYNVTALKNDHNLGASDAFTPSTAPIDPRLDWTVGRRGIPYLDWGLCGGEQWSRGDITPYNPIKNIFFHANQASTSDNAGGWASNQGSAINYNYVRFADVILWRAECEVEAGSLAAAEADVNLIRNRMANHQEYWVHNYKDNANPGSGYAATLAANYVIAPYSGQFAANGQAFARKAVYLERQLEFGMEGHRFFDLQRYDGRFGGPAATGFMAAILNDHITQSIKFLAPGGNPVLQGHTFTAGKNEIYPVPQSEIDIEGGALKQNAGY